MQIKMLQLIYKILIKDYFYLIFNMDWTNVIENTISGIIVFIISSIITFVFYKIFGKLKEKDTPSENRYKAEIHPYFKNPFLISLFVTSLLFVLTIFFAIYSPTLFYHIYSGIGAFIFIMITYLIYENQCPNCKKIFHKKLIDKETLKEEKRPYRYRDETIYYYSDGSVKERKFTGPLKTIMETIRIEKEYYECTSCHFKWDKIFERNLDIKNRPKPNEVRTKIKPPEDFSY